MKEVNLEVLHDVANRLMFEMSDEEYQTLLQEFDTIIAQMKLIGEIPGLDQVEPMVFPFTVITDTLREDEPMQPLTVDEVLANAQDTADNQIRLPKVVG